MTTAQRAFILAFVVISAILIYLLKPILLPFLSGILLAYLGDPLVDRLEERGFNRSVGVSLVFLLFFTVFTLIIILLVPLLGRQIAALNDGLPLIVEWIQEQALPFLQNQIGFDTELFQFASLRDRLAENWLATGNVIGTVLSRITTSGLVFLSWVANLVLIPVVAFYLMRDWDILMADIRIMLPRNIEPTIVKLAVECDEVLSAFIRGQLMIMLLLGLIYAVGLWIVGLNLALLIGMLAGLASVVPYMGFIVGISAALIAAMVQFAEIWPLVGVVVVFGIGQLLEGFFLTPLLVGNKIGLHPVAVIFAILAGGQLFGFVGVLLALPIAAIIMVLLRHAYGNYQSSHLYTHNP